MYDVAVCDDSEHDCKQLVSLLTGDREYGSILRIHDYKSGKELLEAMDIIHFSLIFLDIQMKEMNGEETAERIRRIDRDVVLVFCTGYVDPSLHSFEVQPYRYMKKTMGEQEKKRYLKDALERMVEIADIPFIPAKSKGKKFNLNPHDIVYMEKYKKATRVYLSKQAWKKYDIPEKGDESVIRVTDKLENIYRILSPFGFGYPHDSYIVNFKYLMACTEKGFMLEGYEDFYFKYTRSKAPEFRRLLIEFADGRYRVGKGK